MKISEFREGMKVTRTYNYLNHAAAGPLHDKTLELLNEIAQSQKNGTVDVNYGELIGGYSSTRNEIAELIHADINEICLTSSTSHGISLILESLGWSDPNNFGNKGMIINDMEFNANSFGYQQINKKFGNPLYVIKKDRGGILLLEDYERVLQEHDIGLVGVSHVQFTNGFRTDLTKLKKLCHQYGALLLVDAIQSCGVINITAKECDFMCVGGYKWILGPITTGFLYVEKQLIETLEPIFVSTTSDKNNTFLHSKFNPFDSARKFQSIINSQWLAMGNSINLLNQVGIGVIEEKMNRLTDFLTSEIQTKIPDAYMSNLRSEAKDKSGIVNIKFRKNLNLNEILNDLQSKGIIISHRDHGLRVSPHFYNTLEEIDEFIRMLKIILDNN